MYTQTPQSRKFWALQ